jgi:hypothetical protein
MCVDFMDFMHIYVDRARELLNSEVEPGEHWQVNVKLPSHSI